MAASKAHSKDKHDGRYVALARRYRPTRFEDVIGQQHVTRTLQNAITTGRVHHAYLFAGSRGIGKTTVARILSRALNHPEGPTATPPVLDDPEQEARNAVDVIEIDGASHTGVDDVRELRENVRYLPQSARHKIYIIDEVHMLSTSAFNALLKTLEEPPAHVVFVFATTEPHKIPATILSRCQRFDFKRVSTATIVTHLEQLLGREGIAVERAGLSLIARAAEGGVRDALSLLDQVIAYSSGAEAIATSQVAEVLGVADRRSLFALSKALLARDTAGALGIVDSVFVDGHDLTQFAQAFLTHLRDLVVVASCGEPDALIEATEAELVELGEQSKATSQPLLQQMFERFAQTAEQIARSNFPRLLLEMVVVELAQAEPMLPLGDLLERLETLERQLSRGGPPPAAGGGPRGARRAPGQSGGGGATREIRKKPDSEQTAAQPASPATESAAPPAEPPQGEPSPGADPASSAHSDAGSVDPGAGNGHSKTPLGRWRHLLGQIHVPSQPLYASGRLVSWDGNRIELGYPQDAFELQTANDSARRKAFTQACAEHLGHPVELRIRALSEQEAADSQIASQSAIVVSEQAQQERSEQLRQEARAHPVTRALVDDLGAKIKRINTEANGTKP